jgi:A/G-specific adenine glycosylase
VNKKKIVEFQNTVWSYYKQSGRDFLWRRNLTPYKIWVSEVMLQQTQTSRVAEKFPEFLKRFPSIKSLAESSQSDVLKVWVGLGYNRRALFLKKGAEYVRNELGDKLPREVLELEKIPGIGHYTARAIATFVWDQRHAFIETNIRTVYFNHFFKNKENVTDKELLGLVEKTLPEKNFREWYWALMDYGVELKKQGKGKNTKSRHYTKQSKFEGSDRQIRAAVVRYLAKYGDTGMDILIKNLGFDVDRAEQQIQKQIDEGMLFLKNGVLSLD